MLSAVLVLTLLLVFDPVRLTIVLFLISRPQPLPSLIAYWIGAMAASVPYMLGPLTLLHVTPGFRSFVHKVVTPATFTSPLFRHVQVGIGVLMLSIVVVIVVRSRVRRRQRLAAPDVAPALVTGSEAAAPITSPFGRVDASTAGRSVSKRLLVRARNAWENGSSWPALLLGAASGPPPLTILLVLTTIMASDAAVGAQYLLAIMWVFVMFAVVEIILVSHLVAPVKTQAVLQVVHNWVLAHRGQILVAMCAVVGVAMLAQGTRSI